VLAVLGAVFGVALGSAVASSVLIHLLDWWLGVPAAAALIAVAVVRRRTGAAHRAFGLLGLSDVHGGGRPRQVPSAG
jgi:hypothetical protein